ncbi:MAG: tetratricopeptide repeat protein [Porphyromonas sp.]|nr:tetratricopeptide repeat protein [Porphyromonas sp.]
MYSISIGGRYLSLYLSLCRLLCLGLMSLLGATTMRAQFSSVADSARYVALIDSSFTAGSQGRFEVAERHLSEAIRLVPRHPANALLLNNLGGIQQLQGKTDAAILSFSAALERMPDEQTTRLNRARLFALLGKHQAAITDYSLLIAKNPKNELYLYQRAMSYMLTAQYDLAASDLSQIIEMNGESLKARLGYALLETARGNYDEAERLFDYLASKLSKSPEVYEGRARLYHARRMRGYAMRDVERAFELSRSKPSATLYRLRADILRSAGDEAGAQRDDKLAEQLERQLDPLK